MKRVFGILLAILGAASLPGCSAPPAVPDFGVKFRVVSDEGSALPDVAILIRNQPIGRTNERGELDAHIEGAEGVAVAVSIQCGPAYRSPEHSLALRLTRTRRITGGGHEPGIFYDAFCARAQRNVVVVARADKLAGIPLTVEGKQVAVTDADGNAHALISLDANVALLHVGFETATRPELLPKDPGRAFDLGPGDDIITIEQKFSVGPKSVHRRSVAPQPKHVPVRLD